jgi:hypothetical protein
MSVEWTIPYLLLFCLLSSWRANMGWEESVKRAWIWFLGAVSTQYLKDEIDGERLR